MVQHLKGNQGKTSSTRGSRRKWEWGHVTSKLHPLSGSPTGWADGTSTCSKCPHANAILITSFFPYLGGSAGSFCVDLRAQGTSLVLPSKTQQGTPFGPEANSRTGQLPLYQYLLRRRNANGQPAACLWIHIRFSTSNFFNWKNHDPAYWEETLSMTELSLLSLPFTIPLGQTLYTFMNMMLPGDERSMATDKIWEESLQLHLSDPNGTLAHVVGPTA